MDLGGKRITWGLAHDKFSILDSGESVPSYEFCTIALGMMASQR